MLLRCYDHVERKCYKGFTLLSVGWSDGRTFIPVNFKLLGSGSDDNLLERSHIKYDKRTLAAKRRLDARTDKLSAALSMLRSIKGSEAQAKYVIYDSWYASPSFIRSVKESGYETIARLKDHDKYRYLYRGEHLPISAIYGMNRKRRGKSKYLLSVTVGVRQKDAADTIPAKIVYIRDRSNRKKWIALITTDTSLTEEEVIQVYGKRWDIEPFHKMLKTHLRLEKEFQLRSYDAITAHATIVMTRYVSLSVENRENKDLRSINEGFYALCKELDDISFSFAFEMIISAFRHYLSEHIHFIKEQIDTAVECFISCLPDNIRDKLRITVCES